MPHKNLNGGVDILLSLEPLWSMLKGSILNTIQKKPKQTSKNSKEMKRI
jgi:hypothetical protein